jgi:hypothetical protein
VLLTERTAYQNFFLKQSRATGVPSSFVWKSVVLDAVESHRAVKASRVRVRIDSSGKLSQLSGIVIPLSEILDAGADNPELTDEPHTVDPMFDDAVSDDDSQTHFDIFT